MNIAITGLNATDNPGPGVPLIRSLREFPGFEGKITGLIYDTLEPGIYMDDIADNCYLIPYPSAGHQVLAERILSIHEKNHIDFIIPTLDSELFGFIKIQDRLASAGITTFLPTQEQLNIRSKDNLFAFSVKHEIKVPKNILLTSAQDVYTIPSHMKYPLAIKGIFYDAYIVHNFEEAMAAFHKISSKWGFPIIAQECVKGDEYNVVALGDGLGGTVGAVAMRKLYITDKGKGWAGITIHDEPLIELAHKVIQKTKWRSGMELEFIKSADTGEYYLLEINPRFPAWTYLAPVAGQNLPWAMVQIAQGKKILPFTSYETGKIFVRCSWDLITDIKKFEQITVNGEIANGK
ncbi:MAG: ATP-grasp domain-containing protein [Ignavibacteriales bacterium]|nr:ATP-grasp domain-containing protein [Ignavibacteriales bacterium]